MVKWLTLFLKTRQQRVVNNECASDQTPVLSGLPQGSILGHLLFILLINDLPSIVSSPLKIFTDDVAIYCPVNKSIQLYLPFRANLNNTKIWQIYINCNR